MYSSLHRRILVNGFGEAGKKRGPKGQGWRPEGPRAGGRFLERGQPALSPPARGSEGAL